jgi:type III secretion protein U
MSEKTKPPTPKKLKDAAERGDMPRSQSFSAGFAMLVWWMLLPAASTIVLGVVAPFVGAVASLQVMRDPALGARFYLQVVGLGLAVPALLGLLLALASGFIQSRGRIASKRQAFDLKRLNPAAGIKQLFGLQKLANVSAGVVKTVLIGATGYWMGRDLLGQLYRMPDQRVDWLAVFTIAWRAGWKAAGFVVLGCLALGSCDLLIQHRLWRRRNRMSAEEVKREYKEQEGSPEVKRERRRLHREMSS